MNHALIASLLFTRQNEQSMANTPTSNTPTSLSVAIVGAGFSGLSLAIALERSGLDSIIITIFESRLGNADDEGTSYIVGDLFLPNGRDSMGQLGMSEVWEVLTKEAKTGRPNCIPQEGLQRSLRCVVAEKIRYGHRVIGIREDTRGGGSFVDCIRKERNSRRKARDIETREGPFDIVAGADGVISCVRKCSVGGGSSSAFRNINNVALLGDGRWCQDRLDLGSRRIKCGADIAIQDGIELARLLTSRDRANLDLGKFSARKKRHEISVRRMNICVVFLAILLWQRFPFNGRKTNIAPLVFVSALIHIGGILRLQLPTSVSAVPITLHTLAVCFGGMALGPVIGCQGTILYVSLWVIRHMYTNTNINSFGYIIGLMPCAIVSGALYNEDLVHPILAASIGQSCTLILGVLWVFALSPDPSSQISTVLRHGALPFLPGLLIKSVIAWLLVMLKAA